MNKKVKVEKWEKDAAKKESSIDFKDYKKRAEEYGLKSIKDLETAKKEIINLIAQSDYNSMLHAKKFAALNQVIDELFIDISNCFKSYNEIIKGLEKQAIILEEIKEEINKIKKEK